MSPLSSAPMPRASDVRPATSREWIAALVLGCALTCALTYPTIRHPGQFGRFDTGDGRFSIWNVAWVAHALVDDPRHLLDANIFFPHPDTLTYSELNLVAGVLGAPMYALTRNPVAAHNSAVLLGLLAAFMAMWALVRRLTGLFSAALVAATGYTFSPYTPSHSAEIQLLMIFGFPLTLLALHALRDRPGGMTGVALGLAVALTALASGYYGVFVEGVVGLGALLYARRLRAYWFALTVAAVTASAIVLTVYIPYSRARTAAGAVRTTSREELITYSARPHYYLRSPTRLHARLSAWITEPDDSEVMFPGVVVGSLALVGIWAAWRDGSSRRHVISYVIVGVAAFWASLGPPAGLYSLAARVLPGISMLRAPSRLGIVAIFALAVLAGIGCAWIARRRPWFPFVMLAAMVTELWVPWPLQGWPRLEPAYHLLATLPRGGVVELPFRYVSEDFHRHTQAMIRSMANWQPLLNGYSDFIPRDFSDLALPVNAFPDPASFDILRTHRIRYVVVRMADYGAFRQQMADRFPPYAPYLRRLTADDDVWLFEIVGWPSGGRP